MKALLTGANGYIGAQLIPFLLRQGHEVVCVVSDKKRFHQQIGLENKVTVVTGSLLRPESISLIPSNVDVAYYLVPSMSQDKDLSQLEAYSAHNFVEVLSRTSCKQVIYLRGLAQNASPHTASRQHIEDTLKKGPLPVTVLRASTIVGKGSPSFQMIHKLTEKLRFMIAPQWVNTICQPIALGDVLTYLEGVALKEAAYNRTFDICGPDIVTFKQLMQGYARIHHLKRGIVTLPFRLSRLSSYWLHLLTGARYAQTHSFVESMRNNRVCTDNNINKIVPHECLGYEETLKQLFENVVQTT